MQQGKLIWAKLMLLTGLLTGLAGFLLTGCTQQQEAPEEDSGHVDRTEASPIEPATFSQQELHRIQERASEMNPLNSLLIEHRDSLVAEHYFGGMHAGRQVNLKSVSKSILSALIGIAIEQGYIEHMDQTIDRYFPHYLDNADHHLKRRITLEDLITMRSGLGSTSINSYGRWVSSSDWIGFALRQPLEDIPGTRMRYSTGNSHLLSVILAESSGMNVRRFAQHYLFDHLDTQLPPWDRDPAGYYLGGNNMALTPRELLQFGRLYLNEGTIDGQRILPESWLDRTFQRYGQSDFNDFHYGYMWWMEEVGGHDIRFAWGHGGQYLFIIPELEVIMVATSGPSGQGRWQHRRELFDLLENHVIAALD